MGSPALLAWQIFHRTYAHKYKKCRSRLLHLLRHFYLGVNGLGYSSLFRLWDYCRMPVFLSK